MWAQRCTWRTGISHAASNFCRCLIRNSASMRPLLPADMSLLAATSFLVGPAPLLRYRGGVMYQNLEVSCMSRGKRQHVRVDTKARNPDVHGTLRSRCASAGGMIMSMVETRARNLTLAEALPWWHHHMPALGWQHKLATRALKQIMQTTAWSARTFSDLARKLKSIEV